MSSTDSIFVLRLTVARPDTPMTETLLELLGINAGRWQKADSHETTFEIFCESSAEARELDARLHENLRQIQLNAQLETTTMPDRNWQDAWKDYFHVERVSPRIVIKPSHEDYIPQADDCVIKIDPGMSFGTGQHATTRGCLQFLDRLAVNMPDTPYSFLDLGCGSGILSIAAAKLGFSPIAAYDIDPDSVRIARENFAANEVAAKIDVSVADVADLELPRTFDVTAANIMAKILLPNAAKIAATVAPGGYLLLAGILTEQFDAVSAGYCQLGFTELDRVSSAEWTSGIFQRRSRAPVSGT